MAAVRFEHDRAAGGERGGGITARGGERQREVAGAEYRHRAERRAVLTQIGARQGERCGSAQSMRTPSTSPRRSSVANSRI